MSAELDKDLEDILKNLWAKDPYVTAQYLHLKTELLLIQAVRQLCRALAPREGKA